MLDNFAFPFKRPKKIFTHNGQTFLFYRDVMIVHKGYGIFRGRRAVDIYMKGLLPEGAYNEVKPFIDSLTLHKD